MLAGRLGAVVLAAGDTAKRLTWHDLRATGITWMAARGDDPLRIKQHAGHSTFSTTEQYIRTAEAIRDGFGDVFPELPACLLGGLLCAPFVRRAKSPMITVGATGFEPVTSSV